MAGVRSNLSAATLILKLSSFDIILNMIVFSVTKWWCTCANMLCMWKERSNIFFQKWFALHSTSGRVGTLTTLPCMAHIQVEIFLGLENITGAVTDGRRRFAWRHGIPWVFQACLVHIRHIIFWHHRNRRGKHGNKQAFVRPVDSIFIGYYSRRYNFAMKEILARYSASPSEV